MWTLHTSTPIHAGTMSTRERKVSKHETKAILCEFRALLKRARDVNDDLIDAVELLDEDMLRTFRIKMSKFGSTIDGQAIERDLRELKRRHGVGHITLEVIFRESFPSQPPFIRVVSPRVKWYTGHVTAGGSICLKSLVNGIHGGWDPNYTIEGMIEMIKLNFVYAERVLVRTMTGPGGMAGPLRIDIDNEFNYDVMQEYSLWAAESAFYRTVENHRKNGW